jgi:RNase P subunit RPR2
LEEKDIIEKIKQLMEKAKEASKQLKEIQSNCEHKDGYEVKFIPSETNDVRRICKTCGEIIGYPNDNDLTENGFK